MAVSPWVVAQRLPVWALTWPTLDLTGATVTARISVGGVGAAATGTITVIYATAGQFTFAPSAADFATAGAVSVQFLATFSGGLKEYADPITLTVVAAL
jgi:hypothetical protein